MLGTATEVIKLRGEATIAWAEFDPAWYLRRYPDVELKVDLADAQTVLQAYLITGQRAGHAPNPWFDELWYRQRYPTVDAAIRQGEFQSGFDEYCNVGYRERSPHWLYNDYLYRTSGDELTTEILRLGNYANHYDHYLRQGNHDGRMAHLLFDSAYYLSLLDEQEVDEARRQGAFRHFLSQIDSDLGTAPTSIYFDPSWYRRSYPRVATQIGRTWLCALHHYLTNVSPTAFDPLADFSEAAYLGSYADVAAAVDAGDVRNGYEHFLNNGVFELRSPCDNIDLRYYLNHNRQVRADLEASRARDAFAHLLLTGRSNGLATGPISENVAEEMQAKALFRFKAKSLLPLIARRPLDFTLVGPPELSVIVALHNNFALTMLTLSSLRTNFPGEIELILVDSGSSDETRFITRYVHGALLVKLETNVGYVRACNAVLSWVRAPVVLFLNNDVELALGAVAVAMRRLASDTRIGAVGGKVVRLHGKLQEAGNIIWRDGTTLGYLRNASPLVPEANFVRDVNYCSAVFLMIRAEVLQSLEGFADAFAPAYYEDVDLCVRVVKAGLRVVYDPSIVVHHYEYGTAVSPAAAESQIACGRQTFVTRNKDFLRDRYIADPRVQVFARSSDVHQRRILFIEDQIPLRMLGSGFVRSNDLIQTMASMGFQVTVFPIYGGRFDIAGIYSDMPETVEVMYDRSLDDLADFLCLRDSYYDIVWIARTHNLDRARPMLERHVAGKGKPPRVILDTEAVASLREEARVKLNHSENVTDIEASIMHEFSNAAFCHDIVAVSEREAGILRSLGFKNVSVIGHARNLDLTPRPFSERSGVLFIGAIHDMGSPNYDSLCWFMDEVLPLVEQELGYETRLTIAGYVADDLMLRRFRDHPRITVCGPVAETRPLYDTHRVFVAPTRFAAGAPYKVFEAASFGLPVVASELIRCQLGWQSGQEILSASVAEAVEFASHVVRLHQDPVLWQHLRTSAAERLRRENGMNDFGDTVRRLLGSSRTS